MGKQYPRGGQQKHPTSTSVPPMSTKPVPPNAVYDPLNIGFVDLPAFRRILLLLKVNFDAGLISPFYGANRAAFELLVCLCRAYEVE